jgi:phytoene dehydrogenase-like protein
MGDIFMMEKPAELMNYLDRLKEMWKMRKILKFYTGKYNKSVAEYTSTIQDPFVGDVINNMFLPDVPVWFIQMLLGLLADGQLGLIEGGVLKFVLPIERRYKYLGGEITYKATVEEILVQDDQAVGVRLTDGSEHYADIVISAADGYSTIFQMLGGRYINKKIKDQYTNWKLMQPLVMISFGVAREFRNESWMSFIKLNNPILVGSQSINGFLIRIFNYSTRFAPIGKTVVQVTFESEWEWWNELRMNQSGYEKEKRRISGEVLDRLEEHYRGISDQVEMTDVATPYTTWRYTRNYKGSYEGWLPVPEIITTHIEKTLPRLKNFYMAGQWVTPGGGVPPCIYSGRHVVQILCHHDRKPFVAVTA